MVELVINTDPFEITATREYQYELQYEICELIIVNSVVDEVNHDTINPELMVIFIKEQFIINKSRLQEAMLIIKSPDE